MTDIIIPLGTGSKWENNELRYTLRSVEKHLSNVGTVYVIGEFPGWLQNAVHIPFTEQAGQKVRDLNILDKIMLAFASDDLREAEAVLYMSDDHFLLQDSDAGAYPYYYRGLLKDKLDELKDTQAYKNVLGNTMKYLLNQGAGWGALDFQCHCPVVYNPKLFIHTFANIPRPEYGYAIKSVYCNLARFNGNATIPVVLQEDLKFTGRPNSKKVIDEIAGRPFFSSGNSALRVEDGLKTVLEQLYPTKSKYEK